MRSYLYYNGQAILQNIWYIWDCGPILRKRRYSPLHAKGWMLLGISINFSMMYPEIESYILSRENVTRRKLSNGGFQKKGGKKGLKGGESSPIC